jgi:hypothetical protein
MWPIHRSQKGWRRIYQFHQVPKVLLFLLPLWAGVLCVQQSPLPSCRKCCLWKMCVAIRSQTCLNFKTIFIILMTRQFYPYQFQFSMLIMILILKTQKHFPRSLPVSKSGRTLSDSFLAASINYFLAQERHGKPKLVWLDPPGHEDSEDVLHIFCNDCEKKEV